MDNDFIDLHSDAYFMGEAVRQARRALAADEVPVGAVIVHEGTIIARAFNQVETLKDATAHAEIVALRDAARTLGHWRVDGTLVVTQEPCPMCAGALVHVRMRRVIFGCPSEKDGAGGSLVQLLQHPRLNHRCEITQGVRQDECVALLQAFFREKRQLDRPDSQSER